MVKLSKQITYSPLATQRLARTFAQKILKSKRRKTAFVLTLEGELGSGKTTFLQGLARGLGIKEKILSPTFVIMRRYKIQNTRYKIQNFYHLDCYRIQKPKEILDLGFKEIISNPQNIVAIEWAERIGKILPRNKISLKFKFIDREQNARYKLKREIMLKLSSNFCVAAKSNNG